MIRKLRWLLWLLLGCMWDLGPATARNPKFAPAGGSLSTHSTKSIALSKKIRATRKKPSPRATSGQSRYGGQARVALSAQDEEDLAAFDRIEEAEEGDARDWEQSYGSISESLQASAPEVEARPAPRPKAPLRMAEDSSEALSIRAERLPRYEAGSYPLSNLMRPLTLPRSLYEIRSPVIMESYTSGQAYGVRLEGATGLTRWLEVGVSAPLFFVPQLVLGDFQAHAIADLTDWLDSPHWVGVGIDLILPWSSYTNWDQKVAAVALGKALWKTPLTGRWLAARASLSVGGAFGQESIPLLFLDPGLILQPFERLSLELGAGLHVHIEKPTALLALPLSGKILCAAASTVDITLEGVLVDAWHSPEFHIALGTQVRF